MEESYLHSRDLDHKNGLVLRISMYTGFPASELSVLWVPHTPNSCQETLLERIREVSNLLSLRTPTKKDKGSALYSMSCPAGIGILN